MRFDKRRTYPEPDTLSKFNALRAIVPKRIGGVIKQLGPKKLMIPINIAVGKMRDATQWYIPAIKFNKGGHSLLPGSRRGDFAPNEPPLPVYDVSTSYTAIATAGGFLQLNGIADYVQFTAGKSVRVTSDDGIYPGVEGTIASVPGFPPGSIITDIPFVASIGGGLAETTSV